MLVACGAAPNVLFTSISSRLRKGPLWREGGSLETGVINRLGLSVVVGLAHPLLPGKERAQ